jgi:hypothetical protein
MNGALRFSLNFCLKARVCFFNPTFCFSFSCPPTTATDDGAADVVCLDCALELVRGAPAELAIFCPRRPHALPNAGRPGRCGRRPPRVPGSNF